MTAAAETKLIQHGRFPVPVDRKAVGRDWAERGYDCRDFVDPPGREWNGFVHQTNELVTVMSGRLRLIIGRQELVAGPGDEVFIPKNVEHSVHNIHDGVTRWLFGYDK